MNVFAAVYRRSPVLIGAALIAVIAILLAEGRQTPGFNLWSDRVAGLTSASILTGVVAAGTAAIEANRWESANRPRIRTSKRSLLQVRTVHFGAVALPLVLAFWLAVAVVGLLAVSSHAYGSPPALWLLSLACALVLAIAIGYSLGTILPQRWFVGPAVGLLFYAGYAILIVSKLPFGVISLYPASGNYITVFVSVITRTLASEAIFYLAASAVLIVALSLQRRHMVRAVIGVACSASLAILAGVSVIGANGQVVTGHNPRDFVCSAPGPELCLNAGYASASQALRSEFVELNTKVAGTALAANRIEQNVEGYGDSPSAGSRSVYLEQWAARDDLTFAVSRYVKKYGGSSRCTTPDTAYIESGVDSWLSGFYESTAGADGDRVTKALAQQSDSAGHRWFLEHADKYFACDLTLKDLP